MEIDISKYSILYPMFKTFVGNSSDKSCKNIAARFSAAFHCPLIVSCYFYGKLFHWPAEAALAIRRAVEFYEYDEIKGKGWVFNDEDPKD